MSTMAHAARYLRADGTVVRAAQYSGKVAGFNAILTAFPGRAVPHPHRDDAVLVQMDSGRAIRLEPGDWVVEQPDGSLRTFPDDQFHIGHHQPEAIAA